MITINVLNGCEYKITHAIFDYNGTLAEEGILSEEIKDLLARLGERVQVTIITADTFGLARTQLQGVKGINLHILDPGNEAVQKRDIIRSVGGKDTICFGNGANDGEMFAEAALAVGVIGREGAYQPTLAKADIIVTNPRDAIMLLLNPRRIVATLRL